MLNKVVLSYMLIWLTNSLVFSQNYVIMVKQVDSDKWGYINIKGEYIFEAKFRKCNDFSKEGLAPVFDPVKLTYYFIGLNAQVLPVEIKDFRLYKIYYVDIPEGFHDGLVRVCVGKKWGYLNTSGKVAIPIKFDKAQTFSGGYAIAWNDRKIIILDKNYGEHPVDDINIDDVKSFSEDLAPFVSKNNLMGFIDNNGKIIIQAKFLNVGYFNNGLAWAKTSDYKIGYINKNGDWVIQPKFEVAKSFDMVSGMARIRLNEKMGFVNEKGELLFINDTEDFGDFVEGLCWGRKNDEIGFFNNKGEWVITPRFQAVRDFKNGYAAAKSEGKWGIIDKEGKWIIIPKFEGINDMELVE